MITKVNNWIYFMKGFKKKKSLNKIKMELQNYFH